MPGSATGGGAGGGGGFRSAYLSGNDSGSGSGEKAMAMMRFPEDLTMPPPSALPLNRTPHHRSPQTHRPGSSGRTPTSATHLAAAALAGVGGARPLRAHRLSAEDEAAVEAAVEIGFLLTQYNQTEADLLLQTLQREGNLNLYNSAAPTPRLDTSRFGAMTTTTSSK